MKQTSILIAKSLVFLAVSSLVLSLIISLLYQFNLLSTNSVDLSTLLAGSFSFLLSGAYLGSMVPKKAFLHSFSLTLLYFILSLCFIPWTWNAILRCLLKGFMFNLGCILVHLIKHK